MIAPTSMLPTATLRVETPFGAMDIAEDQVLAFPQGILGLGSYRRWIVLGGESPDRFWLQSVEERGLTLPLADPFAVFPGYALDVPPSAAETLGAQQTDDLLVLAPVTLGHDGEATTANLRGPLIINWNTRRGMQLVVDAGPWSVRETLPVAAVG